MLNDEIRNTLLKIARRSLETAFSHEVYTVPEINMMRGAFVTLRKNGELRGCIGFLEGIMPLSDEVFTLARDAAFKDYRFPPLSESELAEITIEISVLSVPEEIPSPEDFLPGRDGIILSVSGRRAVFLPQVADETGWGREEMLSALSRKAGLPPDAWKRDDAVFMTFTAEVFDESVL